MHIRPVVALLVAALIAPNLAGAQVPGVPPAHPTGGDLQAERDFRYSDLLSAIERGKVRDAVLDPSHAEVSVRLDGGREETLSYPPHQDLADRLAESGAAVDIAPSDGRSGPGFIGIALLGLIFLSFVVLVVSFRNRRDSTGGPRSSGGPLRADTKVSDETRPKVTFRDVAGCDEAVDFFAASGAEFVERYVGVGASRVRELFTRARNAGGGAVVFIDELDALGRRRSDGGGQGGNDEYEHTLNQLLIEMDGFTGNERLVCVGATNRLDVLDPALLRPGRFARRVSVRMIAEAYRDAVAMASRHRTEPWRLSDALLAREDLDRQEITALLGSDRPGLGAPVGLGPPPEPVAAVVPLRRERERRRRAPAAVAAAGSAALAFVRLRARRERPPWGSRRFGRRRTYASAAGR
jgi:ATP-dependent Zn protease